MACMAITLLLRSARCGKLRRQAGCSRQPASPHVVWLRWVTRGLLRREGDRHNYTGVRHTFQAVRVFL